MSHVISAAEWRRCVRACSRVTRSTEDAEDCVQEALLAALAVPRDVIDDLPRWVMTVAQRRAVDVVRRRSAATRVLPRLAPRETTAADPAEVVVERHAGSRTVARLHELPAATAAVVHGIASGSPLAEVAASLGISYRSAESHVTRARRWARRACAG